MRLFCCPGVVGWFGSVQPNHVEAKPPQKRLNGGFSAAELTGPEWSAVLVCVGGAHGGFGVMVTTVSIDHEVARFAELAFVKDLPAP